MKMKTCLLVGFLLLSAITTQAQTSAFTYQGRLNNSGAAASGSYDFRFRLASDAFGNFFVGSPILTNGVPVTNGLFTVPLSFAPSVFDGSDLWLQVDVRTNGAGGYTTLFPLQQFTAAPYAIRASSAGNLTGTLPAAQISGTIPNATLPASPSFSGSLTAGTLSGNGAGVSNVNAVTLNGVSENGFWKLIGNNVAPGNFLGSTNNQPLELRVNNGRALRIEPADFSTNFNNTVPVGALNMVGGASTNFVRAGVVGATIAGGGATNIGGSVAPNQVEADFGTIGGGAFNRAAGVFSTVGGGRGNQAIGHFSTVVGGDYYYYGGNRANGDWSFIGGGSDHLTQTNAVSSAIVGGWANTVAEYGTFVGAGSFNTAIGNSAVVVGGYDNEASGTNSIVGGGKQNLVSGEGSSILGGTSNRITSYSSVISGGSGNMVSNFLSTVGGGYLNRTRGDYATVGGGSYNEAGRGATVAGGNYNFAAGDFSTIAGGGVNFYGQLADGDYSTIGGGADNFIGTNGTSSTVSGGYYNFISSPYSAVGGGYDNRVTGYASVIGGGYSSTAEGTNATVSGGFNNNATGSYATIPGGANNTATNYAFAAGRRAQATNEGSFVWGDSLNAEIRSTNNNSVTFRASGGTRIFSNSGATIGVYLAPGANSWASLSDRNTKKDFSAVDKKEVLEKLATLPIERWHYNWESENEVPHIGPMAQDFKAAFFPGRDDKSISTMEFDGVALAAIQGLNEKVEDKERQIRKLEEKADRVDGLEQRVAELERLLRSLAENLAENQPR